VRRLACLVAPLIVIAAACTDDETASPDPGDATTTSVTAAEPVLFSPEGNNLWAYGTASGASDPPSFASQLVNTNHDEDPEGWDINGQVCSLQSSIPGEPDLIIAGEDTGQPDPPAGWGIFEVTGRSVGDLGVERVARLVPEFAADDASPDTYGCGVLSDGRVVTTTIGNNAAGPANGHLVLWTPPFRPDDGTPAEACVLDDDLATAQQIWVDPEDNVFVASARPPTSGIWRYPAPGPDCDLVEPEQVIVAGQGNPLISPNGVVGTPSGTLYVSSIINGVIAEFAPDGSFRRVVLEPADGEELGAEPYATGTPLGLAIEPDGTLYYADLGLVSPGGGQLPGPGPETGSVRRIAFVDGEPQAPEVIADGLTYPDGLGFWLPA
jgi:hypothetical protein